jgi:hypothetical protein
VFSCDIQSAGNTSAGKAAIVLGRQMGLKSKQIPYAAMSFSLFSIFSNLIFVIILLVKCYKQWASVFEMVVLLNNSFYFNPHSEKNQKFQRNNIEVSLVLNLWQPSPGRGTEFYYHLTLYIQNKKLKNFLFNFLFNFFLDAANKFRFYRTLQLRTFQPQASTPDFSTTDFLTMNS